jgi:hypothetical protein
MNARCNGSFVGGARGSTNKRDVSPVSEKGGVAVAGLRPNGSRRVVSVILATKQALISGNVLGLYRARAIFALNNSSQCRSEVQGWSKQVTINAVIEKRNTELTLTRLQEFLMFLVSWNPLKTLECECENSRFFDCTVINTRIF